MADQPPRTQFSAKALYLAELFAGHFGKDRLAVNPQANDGNEYVLELATPDGPSTGGGTQSVQPIKLVPSKGGQTLVIGSVDQVKKVATHAAAAR